MSLLFNMLSRFVIVFLPRSKCFLISLLQSPSTVTLEHKKIICHCFHCFPIYLPWRRGSPVLHCLLKIAQTHVHWISDAIQPSHPLSSPSPPALKSFPASGSFPVSWPFTSGGQSIGTSASALVLPVNTQDWFPLGWTGWLSLQSKGLSRAFSNTTVQKHQFCGAHLSL